MQCQAFSRESGVPELISAMAGGWNSKLVVEVWSPGGPITTSIGLAVAINHTGGHHVCVVPDEGSRLEYTKAILDAAGISPEVVVGEAEEVLMGLEGVDFLVVDCRRKDFARVLRFAKLSHRGAVLVCKNAGQRSATCGFRWSGFLDGGRRVIRSTFLPVGKGLEIAYVASCSVTVRAPGDRSRWIRHFDHRSGEEHLFRL